MARAPLDRSRLSLAGPWQLVFDPDDEGLRQGWTTGRFPTERAQAVVVPAPWDVTHPDAEGVGFYQRTVNVPASWAGQVVRLHSNGVAYRCEAWVNGAYAGTHEGAYTPFAFDVTDLIGPGADNELVLRVAGLSRTRPVDGLEMQHAPAAKQAWYYLYGGLWGDVWLEALPWVAVEAVRVEPDLQRETALVEVVVGNRLTQHRLVDVNLRVVGPDGVVAAEQGGRVAVPPGQVQLHYRCSLPRPWPWDCDNPHLYRAEVALADGEARDRVSTRFGMRDFTVSQGEFFLNGRPIYLRGVLLQPNYPINLIAPADPELMRREILLVKEAGFNLIRGHLRPTPPGFLDLTDELGMLVYAEASLAWIRDSPRLLDHGRREMRALVERDFNHPSVVVWGIYNENRPATALTGEALLRFTRGLDPTRVVVDNSGGSLAIDQDFGWIDRAHMVPSRALAPEKVLDVHLYLGDWAPGPIYEWLRRLGTGAPSAATIAAHDFGSIPVLEEFDREHRAHTGKVFVSELGAGGMSDLDETVAAFGERADLRDARELRAFRDSLHQGFAARGLDRIFGSVHGLVQAAQAQQAAGNASQIEALMCNPRIAGYVITQWNDVAWEFHAGLVDLWRRPKLAYHASARLNQPHCLIARASVPAVTAGEATEVALTLVNRQPLMGSPTVDLAWLGPAGATLRTETHPAPTSEGIHELGTLPWPASAGPGVYGLRARLLNDRAVVSEAQAEVLALPPLEWAGALDRLEWVGARPAIAGPGSSPATPPANGLGRPLVAALPGSLTEADWHGLLEAAWAGGTALVGPLHPRETLALRVLAAHGLALKLYHAIGNWMGCYHWVPASRLFAGLPANGLAGPVYTEVLPWWGLGEQGGRVLAGSIRNTQTRREAPAMQWYSDIELVPFGAGQLIFCQYRVFERAHELPVAARLLRSLAALAERDPAFVPSASGETRPA
jgi:hypothetical protein